MRLRRPLPAVQGDTLHIVGVGDNRIGKGVSKPLSKFSCFSLSNMQTTWRVLARQTGSLHAGHS